MLVVNILKGLPGSGKSTWALEEIKKQPNSVKRINKDLLREMVDGGVWTSGNESMVLDIRDHLIIRFLEAGKHVIVDDTNLAPKHEPHIRLLVRQWAKDRGKEVRVVAREFLVGVEECVARDRLRPNPVGEKVIRDMAEKYTDAPVTKAPGYVPDIPDVIIVDVDGTLALANGRGPYETDKYGTDVPNNPVHLVVQSILRHGRGSMIVVSGRDSSHYGTTKAWLSSYGLYPLLLLMRPEGDKRQDQVVKKELYEKEIKGKFNVLLVLDDRDRVVKMWRSLGLSCFQVAEGNF